MAEAPLRVHEFVNQLEIEGHAPCPPLPWLQESWEKPRPFWDGLLAYSSAWLPAPVKSSVHEHYDFYHDLVTRNVRGDRPAFRWFEKGEGWQVFSFAELHFLASQRAREWVLLGIEPGETLCIILPLGPEYMIALLAALKLGAVITVLPPGGDRFMNARLEALAPDRIVTDEVYEPLIPAFAESFVPRETQGGSAAAAAAAEREGSYVYASGSPVANLFSPLAPDSKTPIALNADEAYLWALRDGMIAYSLRPGDQLAAPGFHALQYQPSLILATLLAGATYVHIELADVKEDPKRLAAFPIKSVGVTPELRDVLAGSGLSFAKLWTHWWRGLSEDAELERWHEFMAAVGLDSVPASALLVEASAGGCRIFSAKRRHRRGGVSQYVLPSAGVEWSLAQLNESGAPALGGMGFFTPRNRGEETPPLGTNIMARRLDEWLLIGVATPHRGGRVYPSAEVLDAIAENEFVEDAAIIPVKTGASSRPFAFVLLVFVGFERTEELAAEKDDWRVALEKSIVRHQGAEHLPDKIELYPYSARKVEGELDLDWVTTEYGLGNLYRRSRDDTYRLLQEVRALAVGNPGAAGK
jgi:hypothetical protein